MKKKILTICLVVALAATAVIGGTLAYFTDTDSAKNVMTTGSIDIVQNEKDRNGADFVDTHKLYPYTGEVNDDGMATSYGADKINDKYPLFDTDKNAIDKIVTVTNNSDIPVYARTIFAFEMVNGEAPCTEYIVTNSVADIYGNGIEYLRDAEGNHVTFTLGEGDAAVTYIVCEYYHGELASKETSVPSLTQIYLNANVDNDFATAVGANYEILCLSQATQVEGFTDCKVALDTAFGKVAEADLVDWFEDVE